MIAWAAMVCTLLSTYLTARKNVLCWPVGLSGNVLWFVYALWTWQIPIIVINVVLFIIGLYGWRQWRKK